MLNASGGRALPMHTQAVCSSSMAFFFLQFNYTIKTPTQNTAVFSNDASQKVSLSI